MLASLFEVPCRHSWEPNQSRVIFVFACRVHDYVVCFFEYWTLHKIFTCFTIQLDVQNSAVEPKRFDQNQVVVRYPKRCSANCKSVFACITSWHWSRTILKKTKAWIDYAGTTHIALFYFICPILNKQLNWTHWCRMARENKLIYIYIICSSSLLCWQQLIDRSMLARMFA